MRAFNSVYIILQRTIICPSSNFSVRWMDVSVKLRGRWSTLISKSDIPHAARGRLQKNNACVRYSFSRPRLGHFGLYVRILLFISAIVGMPSCKALHEEVLILGMTCFQPRFFGVPFSYFLDKPVFVAFECSIAGTLCGGIQNAWFLLKIT